MKRILIIFFILSLYPLLTVEAVTLPWSTTYDCGASPGEFWTYSDGDPTGCDGLVIAGSWVTDDLNEESIDSVANYPSGGGGKGQIHWEGDGIANNSGGLRIDIGGRQDEFWVRFYLKYQVGFQWVVLGYDKLLYMNPLAAVLGFTSSTMTFYSGNVTDNNYQSGADTGWANIMGGATSDGLWHCYEIHFLMDTNGSNGHAEIWVDDVNILSKTDCDFGTGANYIDGITIGHNQDEPNNGEDYYLYFDDVAISNTGRIGPLSSSGGISVPQGAGISFSNIGFD